MRHGVMFTGYRRPMPNFKVKHHIKNRIDGGHNTQDNLLLVWKDKEHLFHQLFDNMTLFQAANLLFRVARAKKAQRKQRRSSIAA